MYHHSVIILYWWSPLLFSVVLVSSFVLSIAGVLSWPLFCWSPFMWTVLLESSFVLCISWVLSCPLYFWTTLLSSLLLESSLYFSCPLPCWILFLSSQQVGCCGPSDKAPPLLFLFPNFDGLWQLLQPSRTHCLHSSEPTIQYNTTQCSAVFKS